MQDPDLLRRLLRAKDRMDAASHEEWPVRRLARVSGVSEAHFARSFKQAFGLPPHRYLLTRRVERATALLRDTDLSITEIAFVTGWAEQVTPSLTRSQLAQAPLVALLVVLTAGTALIGAGLLTLVDLIPRFNEPTAGRILVDGVDTREIRLASLRALTGIVSQDTVLFNDTVRNNSAYGAAGKYSDAQIEAAARRRRCCCAPCR